MSHPLLFRPHNLGAAAQATRCCFPLQPGTGEQTTTTRARIILEELQKRQGALKTCILLHLKNESPTQPNRYERIQAPGCFSPWLLRHSAICSSSQRQPQFRKINKHVTRQHCLQLSACFCTLGRQVGNQEREDLLLITREEGVGEIFLFMRCKQAPRNRPSHAMPSYHEPFHLA